MPPTQQNQLLVLPQVILVWLYLKSDGTAAKCKGYFMQYSLFLAQQPHLFTTEEGVCHVASLWEGSGLGTISVGKRELQLIFSLFQARLRDVFEHSEGGKESTKKCKIHKLIAVKHDYDVVNRDLLDMKAALKNGSTG